METINSYTILTPFKQVGAGQCAWAQAEKGGVKYFIKRFLRPTYSDLGSPETVKLRKERCDEFERHHQDMRRRLEAVSAGDGNLVTTKDFFRHKAHYYKTTDWVDVGADALETIRALPNMDKFIIALTAVHCVQGLHQAGIVHGDLKPNNILIIKTPKSYAARLIDFDDSYRDGAPPEELIGTLDYYPPEVFRYIKGEGSGKDLTTKADIFTLGIILCEYFIGHRPQPVGKGERPETVAEAAIKGFRLETGLDGALDDLLQRMLQVDPAQRPTCAQVIDALKRIRSGSSPERVPPRRPTATSGGCSVAITTTIRKPGGGAAGAPKTPPAAPESGGAVITTTVAAGPFDEPAVEITGALMKRPR
jgi:serine/threonine protein kinase